MPEKDANNAITDEKRSSERNGIQVIARAAEILRTLQKNPEGLSLGEIAKRVDLARSTVQRIVNSLNHESLVFLSCKNGVRLGPALLPLAAATRFKIAELVRPTVETLATQTRETASLCLLDQDKVVLIDQVPGNQPLIVLPDLGTSSPLHSTASGKALLAAQSNSDLIKFKKRLKLIKQTNNTITSWGKLEQELNRIRENKVAFNNEENALGICSVSTTFISPTDLLVAISIKVPAQRFQDNKLSLAEKLLEHCHPTQIV